MNGIIVADKPVGWTSHDVVARVKRRINAHKVGHLGTLDPNATGVLPLVVNGATRFARFLDGGVKGYEAVVKLGEETDTFDAEGKVVSISPVETLSEEEIVKAFASFRGRIRQIPPMYSSVKRGGTPLYKLARKGVIVERPAKDVEVTSLEVTGIELPLVSFKVSCSKGTYIRVIAQDAGRLLGCGAHLFTLKRTRSGEFTMDEAVSPEASAELLTASMIPLDDALKRFAPGYREIRVGGHNAAFLSSGRTKKGLMIKGFFPFLAAGEVVRFTLEGKMLAVGEFKGAKGGGGSFDVARALTTERDEV